MAPGTSSGIAGLRRRGRRGRPAAVPLAVGLVAIISSGCSITRASVGQDLRPEVLEGLRVGVSREADVIREVGPPDEVVRLRRGLLFIYRLTREASHALELSFQGAASGYSVERRWFGALAIILDRRGVVTAWGLTRPGEG